MRWKCILVVFLFVGLLANPAEGTGIIHGKQVATTFHLNSTYLRLDTSNDPLTGLLSGTSSTWTGSVTAEGFLTVGGGYGSTGLTVDTTGNLLMNGKLTVDGLIDPTGLVLSPQSTTPLGAGNGIWVDDSGDNNLRLSGNAMIEDDKYLYFGTSEVGSIRWRGAIKEFQITASTNEASVKLESYDGDYGLDASPSAGYLLFWANGATYNEVKLETAATTFNSYFEDVDFKIEKETSGTAFEYNTGTDKFSINSSAEVFGSKQLYFRHTDNYVYSPDIYELRMIGSDEVACETLSGNYGFAVTESTDQLWLWADDGTTYNEMEMGASKTSFNDTGVDVDFQVKGSSEVNLLYVNAGIDRIGIGTSEPSELLTVAGSMELTSGDILLGDDQKTIWGTQESFYSQYNSSGWAEIIIPDEGCWFASSDWAYSIGVGKDLDSVELHAQSGGVSTRNILQVRSVDPKTVINVNGNDFDTKILGLTDDNLLYTNAGTDRVGIGTSEPSEKLTVNGSIEVLTGDILLGDDQKIYLGDSQDAYLEWDGVSGNFTGSSVYFTNSDWSNYFGFASNEILLGGSGLTSIIINYDGVDADTKIQGSSEANLLYVNAGTDRVGIGTNNPSEILDVSGNTKITGDLKVIGEAEIGHTNNSATGTYSIAMGEGCTASGSNSIAVGKNNVARAAQSVAMGGYSEASDTYSVALGAYASAEGFASVAMGNESISSGSGSFSLGSANVATGNYSFALGRKAKASHAGTFVWADDTNSYFESTATKQFLIRATNGVGIGTDTPTELLSVAGTVGMSGDLTMSGNTANITHSGSTSLGIVSTSGTVSIESVIFDGMAIGDGAVATTQSPADNSTKLATTAYADAAVLVENLWNRTTGTPNYVLPNTAIDDIGATGAKVTKGWFTDLEITNMPEVSGTSINANAVLSLTADEVTQLATIGTSTISVTQWGYLGALDQSLVISSSPTFVGLTLSGLTSGRVPYATTGGQLTDGTGLTFNGTTLTAHTATVATGDLTVSTGSLTVTTGTLYVEDDITGANNLNMSGDITSSAGTFNGDGSGLTDVGADYADTAGNADTADYASDSDQVDGLDAEAFVLIEGDTMTGQLIVSAGGVLIGDGSDGTSFAADDGTLTLLGTARVKKYMTIFAGELQPGAAAPDTGVEGTFAVLYFSSSLTESSHYTLHIPADWAVGTDIELAIYWAPTSAGAGNVAWEFDWLAVASEANEAIGGAGANVQIHDATQTLDNELIETSYGVISGGSLAVDDTVGIVIYRDHDDADTYGADASLVHVEVEYIVDKLGESL